MSKLQQAANKAILSDPAVENLSSFIGVDGTNTTLNSGRIQINLKPLEQRKINASEVIRRLQPKLEKIDGIQLYMQPVQDLTVEDIVSRTQYQYSIEDPNQNELTSYANRFVARLKEMPALADVASDLQVHGLETSVMFDRRTASRVGVTATAIDNALYDSFGQRQVSTLYTQLNQYHVILEVLPEYQTSPKHLNDIYIISGNGTSVPLSTFTKTGSSSTPNLISHIGQFPATTVSFNLAPNASLGEAVKTFVRSKKKCRRRPPCRLRSKVLPRPSSPRSRTNRC